MYQIEHYLSAGDHKDLYIDWLQRLRDSQAKVAVVRRVTRVELGVDFHVNLTPLD